MMSSYTQLCPVILSYVPLCPVMSRCRVCPAPRFRDEGGPTRGLSRAAERELFERHGITKETMSAKQRLAASATGHVGPGHGR